VLAIGFLLVVSLAVSAWIAALGSLSAAFLPAHEVVLQVLNFVVSFVVITVLFSAIYRFCAGYTDRMARCAARRAVTSVLFTIGKLALGIYLARQVLPSTYGAAASIVVSDRLGLLLRTDLLPGAEFTKTFANCYGSQPSRYRDALAIDSAGNTAASCAGSNIITRS